MEVIRIPLGELQTNCYIISTISNNCFIIDPGFDSYKILEEVKKNGYIPKKIILTHGHFDHTGALADVKLETNAPAYAHESEVEMFSDNEKNLAILFNHIEYKNSEIDIVVGDGDEIELDDICFKIIHTPGHTKGSVVLLEDTHKIMVTGDTLFKGFIGRTDMYGGDINQLKTSLEKLYCFDSEYTIYGGHGEQTTLSQEKKNNYYFTDLVKGCF